MKPGRKPKPTAIKQLQGNPGKRPTPKGEVKPEARKLRPPNRVLNRYGKRLWKELEPVLRDLGVLTEADAGAFLLMCQHYGFAVEAGRAVIDEDGVIEFTVENVRGGKKKNPVFTVFAENSRMYRMYAEQFGLTPSARGRLNVKEPVQLSLAEELFAVVEAAEDGS